LDEWDGGKKDVTDRGNGIWDIEKDEVDCHLLSLRSSFCKDRRYHTDFDLIYAQKGGDPAVL
jgi:hypothetical protein